jgi:hypothetical protein
MEYSQNEVASRDRFREYANRFFDWVFLHFFPAFALAALVSVLGGTDSFTFFSFVVFYLLIKIVRLLKKIQNKT